MPNPLYQQLNNSNQPGIIEKFNEFKNTLQGNPQQMVQQLLNSGQMTQAQYNEYSKMAQEFRKFLR